MINSCYTVRIKLYSLLQNYVHLAQDVVGDAGNTRRGEVTTIPMKSEVRVSNGSRKGKKREVLGWLLFVVSALFFIASSIRNGDMTGLLGGVFFLLACAVFLASYIGVRKG